MHILICDDDAAFGARMAEYVTVYFTARSVQVHTAVCTSAAEVLATPGLELYQLAFLDVDMPGANGMVLGRQLKQKCPGLMLVYVSAYLEFALEGYTVNAYRYLLKRDIARTLPKCLDDLLAALTDQRKTLTVHHNRTETEIPLDQIYYLESDLRQINVYGDIARRPICTYYGKIADLPPMLYENGFFAGEPQRCGEHEICAQHPQLPRPAEKRGGAEREPRRLCGHPERISGMEGAVCG